jgi:hypothetical protein
MNNIVEKHFNIGFTPVRSQGGSLVLNKRSKSKLK